MKKYRIKNSDVERIVKSMFITEGAYQSVLEYACKDFVEGGFFDCVTLEADKHQSATGSHFSISVLKKDIEKIFVYDPKVWNPYPQVLPPKRGSYRIEERNGCCVERYERFWNGECFSWRKDGYNVTCIPEDGSTIFFKPWDD